MSEYFVLLLSILMQNFHPDSMRILGPSRHSFSSLELTYGYVDWTCFCSLLGEPWRLPAVCLRCACLTIRRPMSVAGGLALVIIAPLASSYRLPWITEPITSTSRSNRSLPYIILFRKASKKFTWQQSKIRGVSNIARQFRIRRI